MTEQLTEPDAALYVDRSIRTLKHWRSRGDITAEKDGPGRILYRTTDLDAALALQAERYLARPKGGRPRRNT
ncbi:MerR family transcriptional regulator [Rhodococcus sp. JVH1]|uniref:MerR family transcriptional regulator n=1 Tax=Rhodococcus sp. JVH1 TaxID=745408 RepID=UPI0002721CFD|nr:hypothetical protein [Rhodococcus sp. JVH1]EJI96929.1 hypothetical protein JVH1_5606 [Rhodococcus sp. JVH1]